MNSKKILLPDGPLSGKKKTRKKRASSTRKSSKGTKQLPFVVDQRQRNEAIGLVLVGFSAFSLSLLHYLGSSKISGMVNQLIVYLGMGVYIIPLVIGMMGIQRFMERPFQNLAWRLAGCAGVLTFGLGLLGLEGGKLGVYTLRLFSNQFGVIPSQVLFFFLLMSSLIFALDILYKDLLAGGLIVASLITRLALFSWEILLSLCSMAIEAVKTTGALFSAVFNRVKQTYQEQNINPGQQLGKLLSFSPRNEEDEEEEENLPDEIETPAKKEAVTEKHIEKEVEEVEAIIPEPQLYGEEETKQEAPAAPAFQTAASLSMQVTHFAGVCEPTSIPTIDAQNSTPLPHQEIETNEAENKTEDEEPIQIFVDLNDEENESGTNNVSQETIRTPEVIQPETAETTAEELEDDTVYLEDNQIDLEIKTEELENSTENLNPYAESKLPPLSLLKTPPPRDTSKAQSDLSKSSAKLLETLNDFGIKANVTAVVEGPAVSRFELKPAPGVKVSKITSLVDDIALALSAQSIRIEAPIPGKPALGIEIPNKKPTPVYFYDLLKNDKFISKKTHINLALGVTINGKPVFADLAEMPHLLIAGSTGSGKSVCINTIIASILYQARADQVKMVMIDPKMVELSTYNGIPHLISPVVTDPSQASGALLWAVEEMERRYELLAKCGVRKISTFNEDIERLRSDVDSSLEPMPFIVIIIDELADLMMTASAEVEGSICRLAQMARAVGIHLVIATQRPSVNVLTGLIKANLPTRIAFSVTSVTDSRTILDAKGAERLLGKGDMLFIPKGRNKPLRVQGAFISDRELMDITEYVKSQGQPEYMDIAPVASPDDEDAEDEEEMTGPTGADAKLMKKILKYLETQEKTSTSMLQRKFRIGYNRAARLMDMLEEQGYVSPLDGSNKRRVLNGRSSSQI
jgi:S-DNA-T family DNA segregation ATPase FtsK/SpoIIIE